MWKDVFNSIRLVAREVISQLLSIGYRKEVWNMCRYIIEKEKCLMHQRQQDFLLFRTITKCLFADPIRTASNYNSICYSAQSHSNYVTLSPFLIAKGPEQGSIERYRLPKGYPFRYPKQKQRKNAITIKNERKKQTNKGKSKRRSYTFAFLTSRQCRH